jgi:hypothetical protein
MTWTATRHDDGCRPRSQLNWRRSPGQMETRRLAVIISCVDPEAVTLESIRGPAQVGGRSSFTCPGPVIFSREKQKRAIATAGKSMSHVPLSSLFNMFAALTLKMTSRSLFLFLLGRLAQRLSDITHLSPQHKTRSQEHAGGGFARFVVFLALGIGVCVNLRRWVGLLDADAAEVAP